MIEFKIKPRKGIELSPDIKKRTVFYCELFMCGVRYTIPITKEVKKVMGIKLKNGKPDMSFNWENKFENALRDIVGAIYLQVRDVVAEGITEELATDIKNRFENLVRPSLENTVESRITNKMIPLQIERKRPNA